MCGLTVKHPTPSFFLCLMTIRLLLASLDGRYFCKCQDACVLSRHRQAMAGIQGTPQQLSCQCPFQTALMEL